MNTRPLGIRFGLIALALSLFASTAFAQDSPALKQVVVTNSAAQPVPMIGVIKDSDAPARKPLQWHGVFGFSGAGSSEQAIKVTTVPNSQRLVIEDVSGNCEGSAYVLDLDSYDPVTSNRAWHFLPAAFWNGTGPASTPVRFYVEPGFDLYFALASNGQTSCNLAVAGYYVNLP